MKWTVWPAAIPARRAFHRQAAHQQRGGGLVGLHQPVARQAGQGWTAWVSRSSSSQGWPSCQVQRAQLAAQCAVWMTSAKLARPGGGGFVGPPSTWRQLRPAQLLSKGRSASSIPQPARPWLVAEHASNWLLQACRSNSHQTETYLKSNTYR